MTPLEGRNEPARLAGRRMVAPFGRRLLRFGDHVGELGRYAATLDGITVERSEPLVEHSIELCFCNHIQSEES